MKNETLKEFVVFAFSVILLHVMTYTIFGFVMSRVLNYEALFQQEIIQDFMLPLDTNALLGVAVQPTRGLLFALAIWLLREIIFEKKYGWLILWQLFLVFGILSITAAAPSSIGGVFYTKLPLWYHLIGLIEISLQTLMFSCLLVWWEKRRSIPQEDQQPHSQKGFLSWPLLPFAIRCFAYIGFALSSVAVFFLTANDLDFSSVAGDAKSQMMFDVALIFIMVCIFSSQSDGWIPKYQSGVSSVLPGCLTAWS
jgi:hypothetical protein